MKSSKDYFMFPTLLIAYLVRKGTVLLHIFSFLEVIVSTGSSETIAAGFIVEGL